MGAWVRRWRRGPTRTWPLLTADIPARLARARLPEPARESVNKKAVAAMASGDDRRIHRRAGP